MKVLIVDDEAPARERLQRLLKDDPDHRVVGEAVNGLQAIEMTETLQPDVVLLDIRMPGLSGIEAANHLNSLEQPPAVIFTTAYDEYAIEAFEVNAIGYVLKPVRRERLSRALEQASRISRRSIAEIGSSAGMNSRRSHICARVQDRLKLISLTDVWYFLADQKYVRVRHQHGENLIDDSLKSLEDEFSEQVVRIHRSALVVVSRIATIEKEADGQSRVILRDADSPPDQLIISRRHLADVKRRLRGA